MKKNKSVLFSYFLCIIFYSCNSGNDTNFIPGTYVREVKNEFSIGKDTLVIGAVNPNAYTIIHKASYQRIKEGKLLPVKNKTENWPVTYDRDNQILQETKRGRIISFPSRDMLLVGGSPYRKIK